MVLGFNHNVRYRGDLFHVQTEDSGVANPNIITLLYRGGEIIASRKLNYGDILKFEELVRIVAELMQEQHKGMLRSLKNGEFDDRAFPHAGVAVAVLPPSRAEPASVPAPVARDAARSMDDILLDYLTSDKQDHITSKEPTCTEN